MANTTNFGWETPDDTDLVKDGAAAIRTLAGAIDTSLVDLKGGTTGQVLAKNSNTDMDFVWSADASGIPATIFDAKGDLIVASAADTAARLASSASNGDVLTVDTSTATGLKWSTPAAGGKVLQVVSAQTTTSTTINSTTFTDTGITATITPSSTNSKILVIISAHVQGRASQAEFKGGGKLLRDATTLQDFFTYGLFATVMTAPSALTFTLIETNIPFTYLDSPSSTSALTYKWQGAAVNANTSLYYQNGDAPSTITLLEIGA